MPQYDKLQIYFNGEFKPLSEAKLSIFDHGVMLGDMVFEMTRTFAHRPFMLDAHLDRLMASCKYAQIDPGLSRAQVGELSREIIAMNEPYLEPEVDMFIRHDISRGTVSFYRSAAFAEPGPTVIITPIPLIEYLARTAKYYRTGLHAVVTPQQAIPSRYLDPKCKTRSRLHYSLANVQAARMDPHAWALMLDEHGCIAEGTSSNFHIVKDGVIYTPEGHNILRGTCRRYLGELAASLGIEMVEARLEPYDIHAADEAFFTASSYCICPVTRFDFRSVGDGQVGPITQRLLARWSENVGVDIIGQAELIAERYCRAT